MMTGQGAKKQGCKAKIHPQRFKKIFTPKQLDHGYTLDASTSAAALPCKSMDRSISFTDDVLIFSTPKRLTESSPPLEILDSIHKRRDRSSSGFSALSSLVLKSVYSSRLPYQIKMTRKNLPSTLNRCAHKSDAKHSYSAWERQTVSTRKTTMFTNLRTISGLDGYSAFAESDHKGKINIVQIEPSESWFLPLEVSPGNKFIPIGREVDDHQSFASDDYDILKQEINDGDDWPGSAVGEDRESKVQSHSAVNLPVEYPMTTTTCERHSQPTDIHQQLSQVSLDDTMSRNSTEFLQTDELQEEHEYIRNKYCIPREHEDHGDWFPDIKEEILKVASLFSNCGVTYTSNELNVMDLK